jgi:hypothetical protein
MTAPAATPKDLNDRADLSLIKRRDGHCLRGRRQGQAGAGDECGCDELFHDDFSWIHVRES